MAQHSHGAVNADVCLKCGMTGLQQIQWQRRKCRPKLSARRRKQRRFMGVRIVFNRDAG